MSRAIKYVLPALFLAGAVGAYLLLNRKSENQNVNSPIISSYVSENFESVAITPHRHVIRPIGEFWDDS